MREWTTSGIAAALLVVVPMVSAASAQVPSESPADRRKGRVVTRLRELMDKHGVPGASIAVFVGGEIQWRAAAGVLEAGTERVVTPESLFQAASISKPITAAAALCLVELGELDLDSDVNESLESWRVPDHEFEELVTLRGILCHGAGLTVHGFPGYDLRDPIPNLLDVLRGRKPANTAPIVVDISPGERFRYSGGGYCVAQLMMVDRTRRPFPKLMHDLVFEPVGMTSSTFEQPLPARLERRAAHGHRTNGLEVPGNWHVYPEMAAAGLWTTPSDLARFAIEIQRAARGDADRVLSNEIAREMLSPGIDASYGLGWSLKGEGAAALFAHGGGNDGFRCMLFCYRQSGSGAILMTNADSGAAMFDDLQRVLIESYGWPIPQ